MGPDTKFDGEKEEVGTHIMVCAVKEISLQLDPVNPKLLVKESGKDPVISAVMRYVKDGCVMGTPLASFLTC